MLDNKPSLDKLSQKGLQALDWADLLQRLAQLCHTDRGRELALALPLLDDPEAVETELELTDQARRLHEAAEAPPFGSVHDLRPALRRLDKDGAMDGPTLMQVADTLEAGARLQRFLLARQELAPLLAKLSSRLAPMDDVSGPIRDSFDDRGELLDEASPELGKLRRTLRELHEQLTGRMRKLLEKPEISRWLQDSFYTQREDRYVIPVRSDSGSAVEGIVHGSSGSGQTIFVEPREVVAINNRLKVAEMEVKREEMRIYLLLSAYVREDLKAVHTNLEVLQRLDVINARARLALLLGAGRPRLSQDGSTELAAMRHPLMVLSGAEVVPNDLLLEPGKALIITGPNAGGKTVCIKTLGLCALMMRAGMHLPAAVDSRMPVFPLLLTEMGDDQSIEHNLSTFTAHLQNLLDFLELGHEGVLMLLDEVGVGTDPREGAALAQALLEGLVETGGQVLVTTHFERLKSLPLTDSRFVNASVGFDMENMHPTYRLQVGIPGTSGALDVARRLGLDSRLSRRAASLLSGEGQDLAQLLGSLAEERTRLEEERQELQQLRDEAEALRGQLAFKLRRLEDKQDKALNSAHAKATQQLLLARRELERVRAQLKKKPERQVLQQGERQLSRAAGRIRENEPRKEIEGKAARPEDLSEGVRVLLPHLGGRGVVQDAPRRGKVTVLVGGLRTQVSLDQVRLADGPQPGSRPGPKPRGSAPSRGAGQASPAPVKPEVIRSMANTLDLRGMRVHEALAEMDRFLDNALCSEEPALFLIHGHGTGALRSALRQRLDELDFVQSYRSAGARDGGDGCTVVLMA